MLIYLLEDDDSIRKLVVYALEGQGYEAEGFAAPEEFWRALEKRKPELLLLDVMLPGEDGLSILKKLRERTATRRMPVILLTAKNSEYDKVAGLDSGADDFVAKPFGMMELLARVRALLRRSGQEEAAQEYSIGALFVSPKRHEVRVDGKDVALTHKEFELLCLLLENQGAVLTRDTIMDRVWGSDFDGENRTVDVHVRTLRAKLGEAGALIETVRGTGYKIGEAK